MELRQLAYFVAVVDEAHFTRAAERLRIAQPAVSQQIRRLETELGERLLHRDRRTVALTAAGEALLPHARAALAQVEHGRQAVAALRGLVTGQLRGVDDADGRGARYLDGRGIPIRPIPGP